MTSEPNAVTESNPAAESQPKPVAKIVADGRVRSETVPLEWPVEYDGKTYSEVVVTRPTVGHLASFLRERREQEIAGTAHPIFRWPLFDVPDEILDALDPDDDDRIQEVVDRFLPKRLKALEAAAAAETAASTPSTGADTPST